MIMSPYYKPHLWTIVCFLFSCFPVCAAESQDSLRAVDLPEVVATGTRSEADPRLLPMTVSVISQDQLEERSEINVLLVTLPIYLLYELSIIIIPQQMK